MTYKKKLLFSITRKDFTWIEKRGTGKGGQKRNKTSSAIQCIHLPSGAIGEAEDSRSQLENRQLAFKRCVDSKEFKAWLQIRIDIYIGNVEIEQDGIKRLSTPSDYEWFENLLV